MKTPAIIKKIENRSVSESIQTIKDKFKNNLALNLFIKEFKEFIRMQTVEILLSLDEKEILEIIQRLKREQKLDLIKYNLSESERLKFSHLIRKIGKYEIALNCYFDENRESEETLNDQKSKEYIILNNNIFEIDNGKFISYAAFLSFPAPLYSELEINLHYKTVLSELTIDEKDESEQIAYNDYIFINNQSETLFREYIRLHIVDPYIDMSFIFQQMKADSLIRNIKHLDFAKWLKTDNLISDNQYTEIYEKNGFRSLFKSTNQNRLNNYFNLKEKHIKN